MNQTLPGVNVDRECDRMSRNDKNGSIEFSKWRSLHFWEAIHNDLLERFSGYQLTSPKAGESIDTATYRLEWSEIFFSSFPRFDAWQGPHFADFQPFWTEHFQTKITK